MLGEMFYIIFAAVGIVSTLILVVVVIFWVIEYHASVKKLIRQFDDFKDEFKGFKHQHKTALADVDKVSGALGRFEAFTKDVTGFLNKFGELTQDYKIIKSDVESLKRAYNTAKDDVSTISKTVDTVKANVKTVEESVKKSGKEALSFVDKKLDDFKKLIKK